MTSVLFRNQQISLTENSLIIKPHKSSIRNQWRDLSQFCIFQVSSKISPRVSKIRLKAIEVGCVLPMVIVSFLHHAEFGPNDNRKNATPFYL